MSRGTSSARRTPASNTSTTMSTSRPSVTMSTVMSGYRRRYSNTSGSICRAAPADVLMRSVPAGVSRWLPARAIASLIWPSAGATPETNCSPASVSDTLRVVRWNRRTPSFASSAAMAWLNAERDMPSSVAAARKPRWRATASTASSSISPDDRIVQIPAPPHAELYTLSGQQQCPISRFIHRSLGESAMRLIGKIYIDGSFVTPHGTELFDLHNPATAQVIGRVRLADEEDARAAIAAAKQAFPAFARSSKAERIALLWRMHAAVKARRGELLEAIVEEYGAPVSRGGFMPTTRQTSCSIWPGCWRTTNLRVASVPPR